MATVEEIRRNVEQQLTGRGVHGVFEFRPPIILGRAPTGVPLLDAKLSGGLPRGALTEFCGVTGSGRTTLMHSLLAQATRKGELCALVDTHDAFSPHSAHDSGVALDNLLWIRCQQHIVESKFIGRKLGPVQQSIEVVDLLLQNGGFSIVVFDMGDTDPQVARRIPMTSWFRFRRAVEGTTTAFVVLTQEPVAGNCVSAVLRFDRADPSPHPLPGFAAVPLSTTPRQELALTYSPAEYFLQCS